MATNHPPEHVTLLRQFANTVDVSEGSDVLSDVNGLTGWLRDQGFLGRRTSATEADLQLAVRLRDGLRARMIANGDGSGADFKPLDQATYPGWSPGGERLRRPWASCSSQWQTPSRTGRGSV